MFKKTLSGTYRHVRTGTQTHLPEDMRGFIAVGLLFVFISLKTSKNKKHVPTVKNNMSESDVFYILVFSLQSNEKLPSEKATLYFFHFLSAFGTCQKSKSPSKVFSKIVQRKNHQTTFICVLNKQGKPCKKT